MKNFHWFIYGLMLILSSSCASKKQIYVDRLIDDHNRHLYVNDSLDFKISYFDVISKKNRQTDSIDFKKTSVPVFFQNHLKKTVKRPSEILFRAHRTSMSFENIVVVLYPNQGDIYRFSHKITKQLALFVAKDSLHLQIGQTASGYFLKDSAFQDATYRGSDFMQNRSYNALNYRTLQGNSHFKIQEFHVPFNEKYILRLIWIADIEHTVKNTNLDWEKIDERNHHLELFSLNDSAKYELKEIIPPNIFKIGDDAFKEHGYLGAINTLLGYETTFKNIGTPQQKTMFYQALMTYYSFLGDNKKSLEYMDKAFGTKPSAVADSVFINSQAQDAATYIVQHLDNQRVVMLNEAHNCGQNRAFMRDILRGCYDKGFRYLSLEDLNETDSINERGYPLRHKSGFYNNEPTFNQMLHEALAVGFTLVGHEGETEQREQNQAANILKILENDPTAKVLVWAGHAHIHEIPVGNDKPRMAYYFKKITGIDPLTIEMTTMREHSAAEFESGYYRNALKKWQNTKPFVVTNQDSVFISPNLKGAVDMQVFFPRTDYTTNYPHWLGNSETEFYDLTLDKDLFKDKLLHIFIKKEYDKEVEGAIPVMNIPLSKIGIFKLFLKPNTYIAVVRDWGNWEYFYKEFEVKKD